MSRGGQIVTEFVSDLENLSKLSITRSGISQNVWELAGTIQCLLYVKGRGAAPYSWGVTANVVERLNRQNQKWFIVLLYESKDNGYLLSPDDVLHYITQVWPLGSDGDYKPASGSYLARNAPFTSFNECISQLRTKTS
jgi:hypothetical protein